MEARREVIAPLEGARVRIEEGICSLAEYHYADERWVAKCSAPWPLDRQTATAWIEGWNRLDRFAAFNLLVEPQPG